MSKNYDMKPIRVLGIDLAKRSFQLHGVDSTGHKVLGKKMGRQRLREMAATLPPCIVAMEACGGAHAWARLFAAHGHEVRLIAPQFVKPFVKSNKNDAADAEAICEAAQRPSMRFVAVKTVRQQDLQSLHRARSLAVQTRTAQINQVRGLLLEYGIEIPQGRATARARLPEILEDAENGLTPAFRGLLHGLWEELCHLDERVEHYTRLITEAAQADEQAQRLCSIPGIGPMVATALIAAVGNITAFKNGRELAAWLGLVPRQRSTGGKERLLGISKRGNVYLRALLIHGARSVMVYADKKADAVSRWALSLKGRRHINVAVVALANKITRIAYALLKSGGIYRPGTMSPITSAA